MAVILCVSISLAVCALGNIPCVLGRFKFDFALLEVFDQEYSLVVRDRFQLHKKTWKEGAWCDIVSFSICWLPCVPVSLLLFLYQQD
jgi:hypothetical protein